MLEKESKVHDDDGKVGSNDYGTGILSPNSFLNVIFSPVLNYVGWGETNAVVENEVLGADEDSSAAVEGCLQEERCRLLINRVKKIMKGKPPKEKKRKKAK